MPPFTKSRLPFDVSIFDNTFSFGIETNWSLEFHSSFWIHLRYTRWKHNRGDFSCLYLNCEMLLVQRHDGYQSDVSFIVLTIQSLAAPSVASQLVIAKGQTSALRNA